jgi:hypothetical protein
MKPVMVVAGTRPEIIKMAPDGAYRKSAAEKQNPNEVCSLRSALRLQYGAAEKIVEVIQKDFFSV